MPSLSIIPNRYRSLFLYATKRIIPGPVGYHMTTAKGPACISR